MTHDVEHRGRFGSCLLWVYHTVVLDPRDECVKLVDVMLRADERTRQKFASKMFAFIGGSCCYSYFTYLT